MERSGFRDLIRHAEVRRRESHQNLSNRFMAQSGIQRMIDDQSPFSGLRIICHHFTSLLHAT
jgi:hypothetical protein